MQCTSTKCFNNLVQSVANAGRQGDENTKSNFASEAMKSLANTSYAYQIMDQNQHTVTKSPTDAQTHEAIKNKEFESFKKNDQLYDVELVKSKIEHKESIIVEFFILHFAKFRMLELYYNFFDSYCKIAKLDDSEMITDSLYLALPKHYLYDCMQPAMK